VEYKEGAMKSDTNTTGAATSFIPQAITCVHAARRQLNTATPPCKRLLHHHHSHTHAGLRTLFDVSLRANVWLEPALSPHIASFAWLEGWSARVAACLHPAVLIRASRHGGAS
jgi:hypothetical protein